MSAKYPYPAATLTYEDAIEPIAEKLCTRRTFDDERYVLSARGDTRAADMFRECADRQTPKAEGLAEFVAKLFGLDYDDVMDDAFERADALYEERRGE